MADTKISAATSTTPAYTDLIPMERPGSAVARQATVGAIVLSQTRVYNAVSYGAVAGADSTTAIQAAMDAAGTAGGDNINLVGATNLVSKAGDRLCLEYDEAVGQWFELWRKVW